jgi:hypothetical protein
VRDPLVAIAEDLGEVLFYEESDPKLYNNGQLLLDFSSVQSTAEFSEHMKGPKCYV